MKPGDESGDALPAQLPPPRLPVAPNAAVINVGEWSYERLMQESAASLHADPFACLLREPPGAAPARLGYITGQDPQHRRARAAAAAGGGDPAGEAMAVDPPAGADAVHVG